VTPVSSTLRAASGTRDKRAPVMDINETFISRGRDNQEPYWKGWKKVTTRALKL
jgi:hypothetical protein